MDSSTILCSSNSCFNIFQGNGSLSLSEGITFKECLLKWFCVKMLMFLCTEFLLPNFQILLWLVSLSPVGSVSLLIPRLNVPSSQPVYMAPRPLLCSLVRDTSDLPG